MHETEGRAGGAARPAGARPSVLELLVPVAVFLVAAFVYVVSPVNQTTDSFWAVYTAVSIVDHGDATLDEYPTALANADGFQVDQIDGHAFYSVPLATSLVAVPGVAVALAVDGDGLRGQLARGEPPPLDPLLASVVAAAAVMVVYLLARDLTARIAVGLVTAGAFAFGTAAWSTASRALWMHGPSMLMVALVVWLLLRVSRGGRVTAPALFLGATTAAAVAIRPTNAVLAVGVLVWLVWTRRDALVAVLVGMGALGAAMLVANLVLVGALLPRYVSGSRLALTSVVPEALAGNLVSPARGLLIYSPVLLLSGVGFAVKRQKGALTGLDLMFVTVLGGHLLAVSLFPHWWAGWAFGPRFMCDVLPLLVWFLVPVIDLCLDAGRSDRAAVALRAALVGLFLVSMWINSRGAVRQSTFEWNYVPVNVDAAPDRLWDWSDPPFLR